MSTDGEDETEYSTNASNVELIYKGLEPRASRKSKECVAGEEEEEEEEKTSDESEETANENEIENAMKDIASRIRTPVQLKRQGRVKRFCRAMCHLLKCNKSKDRATGTDLPPPKRFIYFGPSYDIEKRGRVALELFQTMSQRPNTRC